MANDPLTKPLLPILLYTACGDAFGAGHETLPGQEAIRRASMTCYYPHKKAAESEGRYTDDTQMSIAVAEALLRTHGDPRLDDFAEAFISAFKRDPRASYSPTTLRLLKRATTARALIDKQSTARESSGAAMRAGPIGVLGEVKRVLRVCELQASVTHGSRAAIAAAQAAGLMVHHGVYRIGPRAELPQYLDALVPGWEWLEPHRGPVSVAAITCVKAALSAVVTGRNVLELLTCAVAFTGDVDTVCAIAMAAASCAIDMDTTLPSFLIDGLESGPYGRQYLERLDTDLAAFAFAQGAPYRSTNCHCPN